MGSFEDKARAKVRALIDFISEGDFDSISSVTEIEESWCSEGQTQEEGIADFGRWLTMQLEGWSEDYGTEFVVDPFNEECLTIDPSEGETFFGEYSPTSHGEPLDFWFELEFEEKDGEPVLRFNVNV